MTDINPAEVPGEQVRNYYRNQGWIKGFEEGQLNGINIERTAWINDIHAYIEVQRLVDQHEAADAIKSWLNNLLGIEND